LYLLYLLYLEFSYPDSRRLRLPLLLTRYFELDRGNPLLILQDLEFGPRRDCRQCESYFCRAPGTVAAFAQFAQNCDQVVSPKCERRHIFLNFLTREYRNKSLKVGFKFEL
jgi:hypothetical protein